MSLRSSQPVRTCVCTIARSPASSGRGVETTSFRIAERPMSWSSAPSSMSASCDSGVPSSRATRTAKRAMRSERPRVCGSWASMTRVSVSTVRIRVWIGSITDLPRRARSRPRPASAPAHAGLAGGPPRPRLSAAGSRGFTLLNAASCAVKTARAGVDNRGVNEPDPPFEFAPRELESLQTDGTPEPTVLAWRPAQDWGDVRELVVRTDARVAELMLSLVRETAAARNDEARLHAVIGRFAFEAFPNATHHAVAAREHDEAPLRTIIARARAGDGTSVPLSRTIVNRVLRDGHALLFLQGQDLGGPKESIVMSRLETAIVAPLTGTHGPFGVIQLDVRKPARGRFTQDDLDMLSVFASQVGLALEHLWLNQQQQRAFQSTIGALVHSLTLKDAEVAQHCERVQKVSLAIGQRMGLSTPDTEERAEAALLHDLGRPAVSDGVLTKPGSLTEAERSEMDQHAAHT